MAVTEMDPTWGYKGQGPGGAYLLLHLSFMKWLFRLQASREARWVSGGVFGTHWGAWDRHGPSVSRLGGARESHLEWGRSLEMC